jgi:hypothetical protein
VIGTGVDVDTHEHTDVRQLAPASDIATNEEFVTPEHGTPAGGPVPPAFGLNKPVTTTVVTVLSIGTQLSCRRTGSGRTRPGPVPGRPIQVIAKAETASKPADRPLRPIMGIMTEKSENYKITTRL